MIGRLWARYQKYRWKRSLKGVMNWLVKLEETRGIILAWDKNEDQSKVWLSPHRIDDLYKKWEEGAGTKVWAQNGIPVACFRCEKHIHYPPVQIPVGPPTPRKGGVQPYEWEIVNGNFHISCAFEHLLGIRAADLNSERKDERNSS